MARYVDWERERERFEGRKDGKKGEEKGLLRTTEINFRTER